MQRRAAAIYAAFFLVIAAGAYGTIGAAQEPTISLRNPDHALSAGQTVTIAGREYAVTKLNGTAGSAELTWTNESARFTETWDDGATVTVDGTDFTVSTAPDATPPTVTLTEARSLPENATTTEVDGTTYVVVEEDGDRVLVPRDEYLRDRFGPPATRTYAVGDTFEYAVDGANRTVTVSSVANASVTIAWTAPRDTTVTVSEGNNVTLNGRTFVAHFPDANTLELTDDFGAYRHEVHVRETYHERINGLWGVSILSGLAAVAVLGLAYLPSRY